LISCRLVLRLLSVKTKPKLQGCNKCETQQRQDADEQLGQRLEDLRVKENTHFILLQKKAFAKMEALRQYALKVAPTPSLFKHQLETLLFSQTFL